MKEAGREGSAVNLCTGEREEKRDAKAWFNSQSNRFIICPLVWNIIILLTIQLDQVRFSYSIHKT